MKYIDAEKLLAEIERRLVRYDPDYTNAGSELKELLSFITSLQQEPRFPQYDNIVEKVFGAGNLEGWERDEAEMLVALAKEELLKSLQLEQPEVDLEKELKIKKATLLDDAFGPMNGEQSLAIRNFARHFYELGLNARKEE